MTVAEALSGKLARDVLSGHDAAEDFLGEVLDHFLIRSVNKLLSHMLGILDVVDRVKLHNLIGK